MIRARYLNSCLAVLIPSLCLLMLASIFLGVTNYSVKQLLFDPQAREITLLLRLPRVLCAALVGAGLALVGVAYQALFRNQLASPFTLGVSSGAALFASAALVFGLTNGRGGVNVGIWALIGALASIGVILWIAALLGRGLKRGESNSLLLVGVIFSFFCSGVITLIQYIADYSQLFAVTRWMMGGIPSVGWGELAIGAICIGVIGAWLIKHSRELDLMLFGDDLALVKGVNPQRFSRATFVLSSFVVGWVVAQCGVIGFVGIVVPAIARMLVGISHCRVLPISAILGALLVVGSDLLGRLVIAPFEIPAGVFTAVIGGPAFIALIIGSNRQSRY